MKRLAAIYWISIDDVREATMDILNGKKNKKNKMNKKKEMCDENL